MSNHSKPSSEVAALQSLIAALQMQVDVEQGKNSTPAVDALTAIRAAARDLLKRDSLVARQFLDAAARWQLDRA